MGGGGVSYSIVCVFYGNFDYFGDKVSFGDGKGLFRVFIGGVDGGDSGRGRGIVGVG